MPLFLIAIGISVPITAADIPARATFEEVRSTRGMVVSNSQIASRVGRDVLAEGGVDEQLRPIGQVAEYLRDQYGCVLHRAPSAGP